MTSKRRAISLLAGTLLLPALLLGTTGCDRVDGEGVAICLLAEGIEPSDLPTLSHLELGPRLVAGDDLVSYTRGSHEFEIAEDAYQALAGLMVPVRGRAFAVCVDGSPVYAGAIMTPLSSMSYDGVVILQQVGFRTEAGHYWVRVDLGYPGESFFRGEDPRDDPALLEVLEAGGKLR